MVIISSSKAVTEEKRGAWGTITDLYEMNIFLVTVSKKTFF